MKKNGGFLALVCLMSALGANATESNWYVGGSLGGATYDVNKNDFIDDSSLNSLESTFDDTDSAYKVFGGYQIDEYFAVEAGYANLGELSFSNGNYTGWGDSLGNDGLLIETLETSIKVTSFMVNGVAQYPISDRFSVFGKLGVYRWDSDASQKYIGEHYLVVAGVIQPEVFKTVVHQSSDSDSGTDVFIGLGLSYQWSNFDIRTEYEIYESDGEKINVASIGALYRF